MNQQRSRRFRASKETGEKINEIKRIHSELSLKGASLPPEKPKEDHFDSNCITPVRMNFNIFNMRVLAEQFSRVMVCRVHRLWQDCQSVCIIIYMTV